MALVLSGLFDATGGGLHEKTLVYHVFQSSVELYPPLIEISPGSEPHGYGNPAWEWSP